MPNPVLEKRVRQFRAVAREDVLHLLLFAVFPSLHWATVYAALLLPDHGRLLGLAGGLAGIVSGFLGVMAASWAQGRDCTGRHRALLRGLAFYGFTPLLSWIVGIPQLWGPL